MFPWFPCIDDIDAHVSLRDFPACSLSRYRRATDWLHCGSAGESPGKHHWNSVETCDTCREWAMGCFRHGELREFTDQQREGELICHNMSRFECCLKTVYIPMAVLVSKLMNQWIGFQTNPSGSGLADEVPSFGWSNPVWRAWNIPCFWDDQALYYYLEVPAL